MAKKIVRIGLVGVGGAAQINHIPALKKTEGLELVALCDRDREKGARVAQKFGVPHAYTRLEELLADESIDAVDVCTPNYLHAPISIAALEAGKHVLCERPLARSADEAAAMVKAAKKAERSLMCTVQHRFRPDAQLLRHSSQKGDLGEIFMRQDRLAAAAHGVGFRRVAASEARVGRRRRAGPRLPDARPVAVGAGPARGGLGHARACIAPEGRGRGLRHGVPAARVGGDPDHRADLGTADGEGLRRILNLFGSGGAALLNPFRVHKGMHGTLVNVTPTLDNARNQYRQSMEAQIAHFCRHAPQRAQAHGAGDEVLKVMQLMDAIYRSAEQGKEIRVG